MVQDQKTGWDGAEEGEWKYSTQDDEDGGARKGRKKKNSDMIDGCSRGGHPEACCDRWGCKIILKQNIKSPSQTSRSFFCVCERLIICSCCVGVRSRSNMHVIHIVASLNALLIRFCLMINGTMSYKSRIFIWLLCILFYIISKQLPL